MEAESYEFEAELWQWQSDSAPASWYFVTMPEDASADLRMEAGPPRGFGSVRVEARIGATAWRTSVFPQKESGCFVLPVKKAVRLAEGLEDGEPCLVTLRTSAE
ncbi:DUF1905 domain-containing protein [Nocardioides marmoriginsengisoli]|uniref:DUF1905 domain-containing protein n=1 Tax=Nocardioides marmoriginsengisoli TaxID=661483 RepID=A0A3N0CBP8_9ACTN|nr:DUF1905 domain-containing protein [Nocardioides marmoriginsengisoli]RNL60486.1 DUF1905 domain-containing protein [Nocardioides marmoriginsengisoli]